MTGALAGAANEALTKTINDAIDKALPLPANATDAQRRDNALSRKALAEGAAQLVGMSAVASAGGSAQDVRLGASVALTADRFNRQLHPTEAKLIKDNAAKFAKQINGGKEPTQAQIDAAQQRLTATTLNQIDASFDKRITTEDPQAQAYLKNLAAQYANVNVGGGTLFDARGTGSFSNSTINAQYLGQTAPLYNQLRGGTDLKGIAPNIGGAYAAYSDANNDPNIKNLSQQEILDLAKASLALRSQARTPQEANTLTSAGLGRTVATMGKDGIAKPGDGSTVDSVSTSSLLAGGMSVIGDGSPMSGKMGASSKADNTLPTTTSEFVPVQITRPAPGVEYATVNGRQITPQNYQNLYHGTDNATLGLPSSMKPEDVAQQLYKQGLPARGNNIDLIDHATNNPESRAFRGTTQQPMTQNKDAGAVHWAGEGGLVIELKNVRGYDVNAALEGQVKTIAGYKNNPNMGELEIAVPGAIAPENINRVGVVGVNPDTKQLEIRWIRPKGDTK
jgi:hypothetical protein